MQTESGVETQLKEASLLSGAAWAVIAERVSGAWLLRSTYHLNKSTQTELMEYIGRASVDAWLCGSLSSGNVRSGALPKEGKLGSARIYAFPLSGTAQSILVGADELTSDASRIWKLTASLLSGRSASASQSFLPDLQSGTAFNLPLAIEKVLGAFVQAIACQGAWIAIRRGDSLDILAEWNEIQAKGLTLQIESNPILRRVNRSLAHVVITRGQPNWDNLPYGTLKQGTNIWVCIPLVIGQRLIGVVALWRQKEFSPTEWAELHEIASRFAPSVEVVVTFSEMGAHLRRLGLLNDFVLTISTAQNLDQIALRVFGLLSRAFNTELIGLFLRSSDGRILRDYHMVDGKVNVISVAVSGHVIQPFLKDGMLRRVSDTSSDAFNPIHKGARSGLIVPLKYRGSTMGILIIESSSAEAFSQYDEHLMVVITSHLAAVIEYTRLREEAEGRARSLSLIHEVVQQVIALKNKKDVAQITADLLARYFRYELAMILLIDDAARFSIQGIGGTHAEPIKRTIAEEDFIGKGGIAARVSKTGESLLINDTRQDKLYKPITGWEAGAEICVAIKQGDNILGIIDVESRDPNTFSHNDLIAMESLAGILASVVSSADQYQTLQETNRQLREAELEVNARMEAQRSAENRLIQAAKLAAVGEMAAGIAHELNNPLTTVTGFSEIVLNDLPSDSHHRDELEMVLREARRASDVVRRLLDFSRQSEQVRTNTDINQVVDDVIALTRHLIEISRVDLKLELDRTLSWVSIDRNQIKQVLLNLIHNALQAMPKGGSLQVITSVQSRQGKDWITLAVNDSGVGISVENQSRVFEPFFTTKGDRGGTGLGLSVTYGIVTDHGGTIEVSSEIDQGTTFTVYLPL